jgi:hypothetical protein
MAVLTHASINIGLNLHKHTRSWPRTEYLQEELQQCRCPNLTILLFMLSPPTHM